MDFFAGVHRLCAEKPRAFGDIFRRPGNGFRLGRIRFGLKAPKANRLLARLPARGLGMVGVVRLKGLVKVFHRVFLYDQRLVYAPREKRYEKAHRAEKGYPSTKSHLIVLPIFLPRQS